MDDVLCDLIFVYIYSDDILIVSDSQVTHQKHVVLQRLNQAGLVLNVEKCVLAQSGVFWDTL